MSDLRCGKHDIVWNIHNSTECPMCDKETKQQAATPRTCACCNDDCHALRKQAEAKVARLKDLVGRCISSLRYAANRLDADKVQVQVAGDLSVAAAYAESQLTEIDKEKP